MNGITIYENSFCPSERPGCWVGETKLVSPFRLFIDILEKILIFLLYHVLNAELQIFAIWLSNLHFYSPGGILDSISTVAKQKTANQ